MALVLLQRAWAGFVLTVLFGQWDFSNPAQSSEILTIGL